MTHTRTEETITEQFVLVHAGYPTLTYVRVFRPVGVLARHTNAVVCPQDYDPMRITHEDVLYDDQIRTYASVEDALHDVMGIDEALNREREYCEWALEERSKYRKSFHLAAERLRQFQSEKDH